MLIIRLLLWLLLIAAAWLFRLSYIGWLGGYLFAAVIAVPVFSFLLSLPSMLSAGISLRTPPRVLQGQKAGLQVEFSRIRLLPLHSVTIHLELKNRFTGETSRQNYLFRNLENSSSFLPMSTADCGELSCTLLRFEVSDILGFFTIRRKSLASCSCTVMPQAKEANNPIPFDTALASSDVFRPKFGGGFAEEHDLREYRPGDASNAIHWKLSSKTDSLIVREALVPENSIIYLVLERVGEKDRGLEVLRWLSGELLNREEPQVIVADSLYQIESEEARDNAISSLLSLSMREPKGFNPATARCIFIISGEEVHIK